MMGRGIKILLKCADCKRMVYHTAYNEKTKSFTCRRCASRPISGFEKVKGKWKAYHGGGRKK